MSQRIETQYHATPVGELILGVYEGALCVCDWRYRRMRAQVDARVQKGLGAVYADAVSESARAVLARTAAALDAYFSGELLDDSVPLRMVGTPFQQSVWAGLRTIERGHSMSYQALADAIGHPRAVRAVAAANGANALSIFVPCHRVIGRDGALVGYAGGLPAKQRLLQLEGVGGLW